jgi:transcriptional regulator with XRE-family HTH domain
MWQTATWHFPAGGDMEGGSPTLRRHRLGVALRRLREQAGMTGQQAGTAVDRSSSWISRVESGRIGLRVRDLHDLFDAYGVEDPQIRVDLESLAREGKERGWWSHYAEFLSPTLALYLGFEEEARTISDYQVANVPGLLQTESYMRALFRQVLPPMSPAKADAMVQVRLRRQRVLSGDRPPRLEVVVEEPALRKLVGNTETRREQLRTLLDAARRPSIDLRIVPLARMDYVLTTPGFIVLTFTDHPPIAAIETVATTIFHHGDEVDVYRDMFQHLQAAALDTTASVALLNEALAEL